MRNDIYAHRIAVIGNSQALAHFENTLKKIAGIDSHTATLPSNAQQDHTVKFFRYHKNFIAFVMYRTDEGKTYTDITRNTNIPKHTTVISLINNENTNETNAKKQRDDLEKCLKDFKEIETKLIVKINAPVNGAALTFNAYSERKDTPESDEPHDTQAITEEDFFEKLLQCLGISISNGPPTQAATSSPNFDMFSPAEWERIVTPEAAGGDAEHGTGTPNPNPNPDNAGTHANADNGIITTTPDIERNTDQTIFTTPGSTTRATDETLETHPSTVPLGSPVPQR